VDWAAYLAGLPPSDRTRAEQLAEQYGQGAATRRVRYHPVSSVGDLEDALRKGHRRVSKQVGGLYESIDAERCPAGWDMVHTPQIEPDGTHALQTSVTGPHGEKGFFERAYAPAEQRVELRKAFLRLSGMTEALPAWITEVAVPMDSKRGTPTFLYFTICQFKILGVPAGQARLWRRWLYGLGLRAGPFIHSGVVRSVKMSSIQHVETIMHLHWLRQRYPSADLSELIIHTPSFDYAETTVVQCGYRIEETKYSAANEVQQELNFLLAFQEQGNNRRVADNAALMQRYSCGRSTTVRMAFDIELSLSPV
jgi:hypothetical protein